MSINDTLLIECVRAHPEIYDKGHAGFKNSGIKDSAWKIVGETLNVSATDCTARWHTLRERFAKEKRIFEQEGKSGAAASTRPEWALYSVMSFLTPHIRKRKSVDNFQTKALVSISTPSPDEEEIIINEQAVDNNSAPPVSTCSTLFSSGCSSSAANMPYLGPTSRKRSKVDKTDELFRETLTNLNKSMAVSSVPVPPLSSPPSVNDPDVLISRNVESCLKNLTNMTLRLKYRRKFRSIIQDCEEEAEDLKLPEFLNV